MVHATICNCQYDDQTGGWDYDPKCEALSDAQDLADRYEERISAILRSLPEKLWFERVDFDTFQIGIGDGYIEVKDANEERPRLTAAGFESVEMSDFDTAILCLAAARQLSATIIANQYREPLAHDPFNDDEVA